MQLSLIVIALLVQSSLALPIPFEFLFKRKADADAVANADPAIVTQTLDPVEVFISGTVTYTRTLTSGETSSTTPVKATTKIVTLTTTTCPKDGATVAATASATTSEIVTTAQSQVNDDSSDDESSVVSVIISDPDSTAQPSDGLVHIIDVISRPGALFVATDVNVPITSYPRISSTDTLDATTASATPEGAVATATTAAEASVSSTYQAAAASQQTTSIPVTTTVKSTSTSVMPDGNTSTFVSSSVIVTSTAVLVVKSSEEISTSTSAPQNAATTALVGMSNVVGTSTGAGATQVTEDTQSSQAAVSTQSTQAVDAVTSAATSAAAFTAVSSSSSSSDYLTGHPSAIVYSPYNNDSSCKSYDTVYSDLTLIKSKQIGEIRIYGNDCNYLTTVLPIATILGLQVNQGFWISDVGVDSIDTAVTDLISAATDSSSGFDWTLFSFITIGNEAIISEYCSVDELISKIASVKTLLQDAGYTGLVTTSEPPVTYEDNPSLCTSSDIDFVGINPHSYFDTYSSAADSGDFVKGQIEIVQESCPGMDIRVTETGYPSAGITNGGNIPSPANQKIALQSIFDIAGTNVTILTTFNDYWKEAGTYGIEQSFGIIQLLE
ncbi:hypothetical protein FOA43_001738 [Brettanomyces nanus]|uniref:Uncharacterized protein n=1 Tax=Eeniella nana TaxID=13502 RepID=A0A875S3Q0_EENNA|nr:uncharacterized protein FOA43_001738 [Brettanomyces nanus]QPG74409.1 hypothetical protein FOA43_001738 [Brettanomyces nanus]